MQKITILSLTLIFVIAGIFSVSHVIASSNPDEKLLSQSGIDPWVPNPLVGSHKWKKFFSDEKHSPSKEAESIWYFDSKTAIKATTEKLNSKGQAVRLEGATLVWVKLVGQKTKDTKFLFYGLWPEPEKRIVLFFGIFEKHDGSKYVEHIHLMENIEKAAPGLEKEVLEKFFDVVFKPWWKLW